MSRTPRPRRGRKSLPPNAPPDQQVCRGCGCSEYRPCTDGRGNSCWWVIPAVCSRCVVGQHATILLQTIFGHRAALDNVVHMAGQLRSECAAGSGPAPWPEIQSELTALLIDLSKRAFPAERDEQLLLRAMQEVTCGA